jgi:hypothetical protein
VEINNFLPLTRGKSNEKVKGYTFFIGKLMRNCSLVELSKPKKNTILKQIEQSVLPDTNMSSRISQLFLFCLGLQFTNATVTDTIRPGQSLTTSEYIQSANGRYKLGFFSQKNSIKYHVGIRFSYASDRNVVWVANREHPFPNSSAVLTFNADGNLAISDGRLLQYLLITNVASGGNNTYARLLDSGNLILNNTALGVLWQSFDHPTDTLLPGMMIKDDKTGWSLTSWKSNEDPAPGLFSLHLGSRKELIVMKGSELYWTTPLIGQLADMFGIYGDYISYTTSNNYPSEFKRVSLSVNGELRLQTISSNSFQSSSLSGSLKCGAYAFCGEFSICSETAAEPCDCLPAFKPNTTQGCKRKTDFPCSDVVQKPGFLPISKVFLPSNPQPLQYVGNASECESACLINCDCTGYAYDQEHRCLVWEGPLLNMKQFSEDNTYTQDFYLKLARADLILKGFY